MSQTKDRHANVVGGSLFILELTAPHGLYSKKLAVRGRGRGSPSDDACIYVVLKYTFGIKLRLLVLFLKLNLKRLCAVIHDEGATVCKAFFAENYTFLKRNLQNFSHSQF